MDHIRLPLAGVTYADASVADNYVGHGAWIDQTLGDALRNTASRVPHRPALISAERTLTFGELDEQVVRLGAALLNLGIKPGERAIFQMGTVIETALALLACYRVGIIPVCAVPQYREIEIGQLIEQSAATAYFVQGDFSAFDLPGFAVQMMQKYASVKHLIVARGRHPNTGATLEALIDSIDAAGARARLEGQGPGHQDVLSFQLSGGTTGVPKIIPRFHGEYLAHAEGWMTQFGIDGSSTVIWPLPLLHNAGQLFTLTPTVLMGVTTVLMPKVDVPVMLDLIAQHRVTHALSIGPIAPQLLAYKDLAKHDLSSLKMFGTMSRADTVEAHLGIPCMNFFGITEGLLLGSHPDDPPFVRHHTQGRSGCKQDEIRLLDPASEQPVPSGVMGELCFRGPSSLRAYYDAPAATASSFTSDGFFRTGDLMTAHEVDGNLYYRFEGRLKDNINRGGEKISCEEVETVLSKHPAIYDVRIVAMPDEIYGERACAFLVIRDGQRQPTLADLMEFVIAQGLAKFKCPERIEAIDAFPLTRVGKLDKPALRKLIGEKLAAEQAAGTP
jgi:pyochelin biosynthesis protein PchD